MENLNENKPSRSGGFITRVVLQLQDGPDYAKASIKHPLVYDKKLKDHLAKLEKQKKNEMRQ